VGPALLAMPAQGLDKGTSGPATRRQVLEMEGRNIGPE
jgi:hypothetical protein